MIPASILFFFNHKELIFLSRRTRRKTRTLSKLIFREMKNMSIEQTYITWSSKSYGMKIKTLKD